MANQLDELKVKYVFDQYDKKDETPSWMAIASSSNIPNEIIFEEYDGIDFVEEDFCCDEEEY